MSAGRVWFTSDLHFGHEKVAALRGYDRTWKHDEAILEAWREAVRPKDQVWVLGDLAVSSSAYPLELLDGLPGEKHLIAGNHDQCHPMHRDAHRKQARYLAVFASVQSAARRRVNGRSVLLSHFPYMGDTKGREHDRHRPWRPQLDHDDLMPIIHGHTHRNERVSEIAAGQGESWQHVRQVHVGWDAWGRLVSLDEVAELLA